MEKPSDGTVASNGRDRVEAMLIARFAIDSAFVRVEPLAKVLGIAPSTIYGQMRSGTFCIPFRKIGSTPVVKIDDLVDWYCREPMPVNGPPFHGEEEQIQDSEFGGQNTQKVSAPSREAVEAMASRDLVATVMSKMKRKGAGALNGRH